MRFYQTKRKEENNSTMIGEFRTKPIVIIIYILILILICGLYLCFAGHRYQDAAESEAIMLAQSLESVLHPEYIAELSGNTEDLGDFEYDWNRIFFTCASTEIDRQFS